MSIFARVFGQGRLEKSLNFEGSPEEAGFAFFSFLVGAQTISRTFGGTEKFLDATEVVISSFEK